MSKRKGLLGVLTALALVLSCMVGWTLSYITHTSTPLTNVLTSGKTDVDHGEPGWNPDEDHPIVPGKAYTKDPTPTLKAGSISSYVFMEVTAPAALRAILDGSQTGYYPNVNSDWTLLEGSAGDTLVYYYSGNLATFNGVSDADIPLPSLFDGIKILESATDAQMKDAVDESGEANITIITKSVQREGFATAKAAYAAAFGTGSTTTGE